MKKQLLSETEVLNELQIPDFRHLRKDQVIELVSMIPHMDKEVAIKCIEQFPAFKEYSNIIVDHFAETCKALVEQDGQSTISAYKFILDELHSLLAKEDLSLEESHYIVDRMIEIAERIEAVDDKRRVFAQTALKVLGAVAGVAITVGGALLGLKIDQKHLLG